MHVYQWIVFEKTKGTANVPKCVKYTNDGDMDTTMWAKIYIRANKIPVDTRTKEFQYRFLNNILVNKYWLCKWKLKEDDLCKWCNDGTEDLLHVFWECTFVIQFWHYFERWCKDMQFTELSLTKHDVFFGVDDILLCTLIFAAKRHLHQAIFANRPPSFEAYKRQVENMKKVELRIAMENGTVERWIEKYQLLENV